MLEELEKDNFGLFNWRHRPLSETETQTDEPDHPTTAVKDLLEDVTVDSRVKYDPETARYLAYQPFDKKKYDFLNAKIPEANLDAKQWETYIVNPILNSFKRKLAYQNHNKHVMLVSRTSRLRKPHFQLRCLSKNKRQ